MVTQKCRHLGMVRLITVTDVLVGCREDYRGDDQIEAMEQVKTQATIGCTLTKGERSVLDWTTLVARASDFIETDQYTDPRSRFSDRRPNDHTAKPSRRPRSSCTWNGNAAAYSSPPICNFRSHSRTLIRYPNGKSFFGSHQAALPRTQQRTPSARIV